jgi:hypothetical protein
LGKVRVRIRRPTGVIIAPPNPWTMRLKTSADSVSDKPQSTEPSVKKPMAAQNT